MPLYEYVCDGHGVFDDWKDFARSSEPSPCPDCGALSARILSVPQRSGMASSELKARERNERSCHEPKAVVRAAQPASPARATQSYTGPRPWVIEHS